MVELIRRGLLPAFALAFYKPLAAVADEVSAPTPLAFIGSDIILLAPYPVDPDHWEGFLIAEAEAGGQRRRLVSEDGQVIWVQVPEQVATAGAVMAAEGSRLPIAESPPEQHCDGLLLPQSSGSSPG